MAVELKAQEIRGMAAYAQEDVPSEEWGDEFHKKLARWQKDLAAYEQQELIEVRAAPRAAGGVNGGRREDEHG